MPIQESGENYLKTIFILSLHQSEVHAIDIVNYLDFSKASVSIALKKLKDDGYIIVDGHNHIFLTEKGDMVATQIYEKNSTIYSLLIKLGVDSDIAKIDACKIEHDINDQTFQALKKLYETMQ